MRDRIQVGDLGLEIRLVTWAQRYGSRVWGIRGLGIGD